MKKLIYHIIYRALGILLVALTMAFTAVAQKPILHIVVDQCETIEFNVEDIPGDRFTWDIYRDSTVNFAKTKGDLDPVVYFENSMYEGSTVQVNGVEPGRYFIRVMVWDEVECTNNLLVYLLDILPALPEAVIYGDSTCIGDPLVLKIVLTGRGPWDLTYTFGDESNAVNINGQTEPEFTVIIPPLPVGPHSVWVMEVTDQCTVNSYETDPNKVGVVIYAKPQNSRIRVKDD